MPKITAFLARSFDPKDESKIRQLIAFLESFRDVGFICESAEAAEVQSVSKKVRDMIDASDVFVGILTRRDGVYEVSRGFRDAWKLLTGRFVPNKWSAPPWVIQESGYAYRAHGKNKMILFVESGVELPSVQGDLEYIEFAEGNLSLAFRKASEMINGLLAQATGTTVETVVRSTGPALDVSEHPSTAGLEEALPQATSVAHFFITMTSAISEQRWQDAEEAYEAGLAFIQAKNPKIAVTWKASYHRYRYQGGQPDALTDLRNLADTNLDDYAPLTALGYSLEHFQEYELAADVLLRAAVFPDNDFAGLHTAAACRCMRKAKKYEQSVSTLLQFVRRTATDLSQNIEVAQELHASLKAMDRPFEAFAVAEYALHGNPALGDIRFTAGLDYENARYDELALYHYKIICRDDPKYDMAFNNLGVAYLYLELPILSVAAFQNAAGKGNTLASANLAYRYLESGFAPEASELIKKAIADGSTEPLVPQCMAAIADRQANEKNKEVSSLEIAEKQRRFLVNFGEALLAGVWESAGTWVFPFGPISLNRTDGELNGSSETISEEADWMLPSLLYGTGTTPTPRFKTSKYRFTGIVKGRSCKYQIEILSSTSSAANPLRPEGIGALGEVKASQNGYIAFSSDGRSGAVCEFKDDKPALFYEITKSRS